MGGRRFRKNTTKKINMKKVIFVCILPFLIVGLISLYKFVSGQFAKYNVRRVNALEYFAFVEDGKWGVMDTAGQVVVPNTYDEMIVVPSHERKLFIASEVTNYANKEYTTKVLNENNTEIFRNVEKVTPIEYKDVNVIYDTNLLLFKKTGKFGLVDYTGNIKFNAEFEEVSQIDNMPYKLLVKKEGKYGVLNTQTETFDVPVIYKSVKPINYGFKKIFDVVFEVKHGILGENAQKILPAEYDEILNIPSPDIVVAKNGNTVGIHNLKGEKIADFTPGTKEIYGLDYIFEDKGKVGIRNNESKVIVPAEYDQISKAGVDTYIAKKANVYTILKVKTQELKFETPLTKEYSNINYYKEASMFVGTFKEGQKELQDIIDTELKVRKTLEVYEVNIKDGYIRGKENKEVKSKLDNFYNFKLEEIQEKDVYRTNNLFKFEDKGKVGFKNANNQIIVPAIYDDATYQNRFGYIAVNREGKWGCLDFNGNTVKAPEDKLDDYIVIDYIKDKHRIKESDIIAYTK